MNMDVMRLIFDASFPVQLVMLLLFAASLASWRIIFQKRGLIRKTKSASDDFESSFWSGGDLNTLYRSATRVKGGSHIPLVIPDAQRHFEWTVVPSGRA